MANFVSRQQLNLLPYRIEKLLETDAINQFNTYLAWLDERCNSHPMKVMVVGSGGSYPATIIAKHAISERFYTDTVVAETPQTALQILKQFDHPGISNLQPHYDTVIGFSSSGKTPDMYAVSQLCEQKGYPFLLITGTDKAELSQLYVEKTDLLKVISYFNPEDTSGKEKGIISMFSTLAPAIICNANIMDYSNQLSICNQIITDSNIDEIATALKQHPVIHVLYEWDTFAVATDIESKFTESGLAHVILHEKKNFSHGRPTLLYKQNFALVINLVSHNLQMSELYKSDYEKQLARFLSDLCTNQLACYLELRAYNNTTTIFKNLMFMLPIPYLLTAIGERMDIDTSKPLSPYPKEAIELYNYTGEF